MFEASTRRRARTRVAWLLSLSVALSAIGLATPYPVSAASFVVNRIGDLPDSNLANAACDVSSASGRQCTLRAAIQEANDTPGADVITFNITSASKTITPATPLPPITEPVTINGYSQPNTSANTRATGNDAVLRIVLDGVNAGAAAVGLELQGSDSTVRGLVIQRFGRAGILLAGGGDHLAAGNFIGTDVAGTAKRANNVGVEIRSRGNTLGGTTPAARNVISGNTADGVLITGANAVENVVVGNYIGTRKGGAAALGNGATGIKLDAGLALGDPVGTRIGDGTVAGRNVISGNTGSGVEIQDGVVTVVAGNYIGTNAAGSGALANGNYGIDVSAHETTIGGDTAGERNVISGNGSDGIIIRAEEVLVIGNYIGLDSSGNAAIGNASDGIFVFASDSNSIGLGTAATRNVISGNASNGIRVTAGSLNRISGNRIGTRADGTGDVGNGVFGVSLTGATSNEIGGPEPGDGNSIVGNGSHGVHVDGPSTANTFQGNAITANDGDGLHIKRGPNTVQANTIVANGGRGIALTAAAVGVPLNANSIFGNGALEIDLVGGTEDGLGVTANDPDDPDTGANNLQNFPVLTSAVRSSVTGGTTLIGSLNSTPSTSFRVDVYLVVAPDASSRGGAQALIATKTVATDTAGDVTFNIPITGLNVGQAVTALVTATGSGNTSELSVNITVTP